MVAIRQLEAREAGEMPQDAAAPLPVLPSDLLRLLQVPQLAERRERVGGALGLPFSGSAADLEPQRAQRAGPRAHGLQDAAAVAVDLQPFLGTELLHGGAHPGQL